MYSTEIIFFLVAFPKRKSDIDMAIIFKKSNYDIDLVILQQRISQTCHSNVLCSVNKSTST